MDNAQRFGFRVGGIFMEDPAGTYVTHADYATLLADRDRLAAEVEGLRADLAEVIKQGGEWIARAQVYESALAARTDAVIVHGGQALACSQQVADAYLAAESRASELEARVRAVQRGGVTKDHDGFDEFSPHENGWLMLASDVLGAIGREGNG